MKTTLLIMAAGIGSRFGTGIKQLEPVDDAGHIIMVHHLKHHQKQYPYIHHNLQKACSLQAYH